MVDTSQGWCVFAKAYFFSWAALSRVASTEGINIFGLDGIGGVLTTETRNIVYKEVLDHL
jgi:hypothetical protein